MKKMAAVCIEDLKYRQQFKLDGSATVHRAHSVTDADGEVSVETAAGLLHVARRGSFVEAEVARS